MVPIWEGQKCRINRILFRTRCRPFADYVVILASSGRHAYPNNPKRGGRLTAVLLETKWKPANRILQPFNWLFSRLNTVCTYMKLRQNGIVSLMIRPAVFLAGGRARVKLHQVKSEPQNIEYRISKGGFASLSHFYKIDRIPYFDIRYSLFDIRYSLFQSFFSNQTGPSLPRAALI